MTRIRFTANPRIVLFNELSISKLIGLFVYRVKYYTLALSCIEYGEYNVLMIKSRFLVSS